MAAESRFERCVDLPVDRHQAFDYHDRVGALARLVPPWERVRIERSDNSLQSGSKVVLRTGLGPIPLRWLARHEVYDPPNAFTDIQVSGPFKHWHHEHRFFEGERPGTSQMLDRVTYRLPLGGLGKFFGGGLVSRKLDAMFDYRHVVTSGDLQMAADYPSAPLNIAVSGTGGLLGGHFCNIMNLLGHQTRALVRGDATSQSNELFPWADDFDPESLAGTDAVVHLAGKPIADGRWTDRIKADILTSRSEKTEALCRRLAEMQTPPKTLVCASAIGIYGDRGDEELGDDATTGSGFLAEVGKQWEAACKPARDAGIRVVNLRIGIVLSPNGGALEKLLIPAKLGVNGPVGSGKQWWSWIGIDDMIGAIYHAIHTEAIEGAVNAVAPNTVRNKDFARILGRILSRPGFIPSPAFVFRIAMGEMADHLLLASNRVLPNRLVETGYRFRFSELEPCLRHLLGKTS